MGIFLGLASALSWGASDLLARFATRKLGTFRTMLYMQLLGFVLLTLVMRWLGGWGHLFDPGSRQLWLYGVSAGLLNTGATLALYRSFQIGKMSVVAPVSASYPVLTMLLSAATGERLTILRLAGILLTVTGVVLVARGEKSEAHSAAEPSASQGSGAGIPWALVSALGFGVMFWLLGLRVVPLLGGGPSVWLIRLTSFVATAVLVLLIRAPIAPPSGGASPWIFGIGVLDTTAYVLNNFGMQHEQTSIVSVLASLYGAVTVGLAALILQEPVSRAQWLGIVSIFAGVVLIGY